MMAERSRAAVYMMECLRRRSSRSTWYSSAERLQILVIWVPFESIQLTSNFRAVVFPSERIRHGRVKTVIRKLRVLFGNEPKQAELKRKGSRNGRRYRCWYETNHFLQCGSTLMTSPSAQGQPFYSNLAFFLMSKLFKCPHDCSCLP